MIALVYWFIEILSPLIQNDWYFTYGTKLQFAVVAFIAARFILKPSHVLEAGLFFISLYVMYSFIVDLILGGVSRHWYMIETLLFSSLALWIVLRPEMSTQPYSKKNILLAFYKGEKGSFRMRVAELFGLPVRSIAVVADGSTLRIKGGSFIFMKGNASILNSSNYLVVDTGVKSTESFVSEMTLLDGRQKFTKNIFMSDCIYVIKPLLSKIGAAYSPKRLWDFIPSIYLRKCLKVCR